MTGFLLSTLGILALYGTGDLSEAFYVIVLLAFAASKWTQKKITEKPAAYLIGFFLACAAFAIAKFRISPVVVGGYALLLVHIVAWFSIAKDRIRIWELPLTFLEIALASAMSPDFYLALIIVVFVVISSQELGVIAAQYAGFKTTPKSMRSSITYGILLSIILGILLFPFLPRTKTGLEIDWARTRIGYADSVDLSKQNAIQQGPPKTVLRVLADDTTAQTMNRLLRGRVLDHFSGQEWYPKLNKSSYRGAIETKDTATDRVTIIREPIDSSILPVPYGALDVIVDKNDEFAPARRSISNEWTVSFSETKRIQYDVSFLVGFPNDPPTASNTKVPENVVTPRIQRLISRLFLGAPNVSAKISRIQNYFKTEQFEATTDPLKVGDNQSLFEEFLIFQRRGNCELFSSSAALMLRYVGIPARLVSGFRISRKPVSGFINVTNRDAHAWVEIWNAERGIWISFDPTPKTYFEYTWLDEWVDRTELAKSIWYRYIVSYDPEATNQKAAEGIKQLKFKAPHFSDAKAIIENPLTLLIFAIAIAIAVLFFIRPSMRPRWITRKSPYQHRIERLAQERARFEKLIKKGRIGSPVRYQTLYDEVRFGIERSPLAEDLKRLRSLRRELTH